MHRPVAKECSRKVISIPVATSGYAARDPVAGSCGKIPASTGWEFIMDLLDLHRIRGKHKAKPGRVSLRVSIKRLSQMTESEINALPERQFLRLLDAPTRRAYLAAKKLKGKL